MKNQITVRRVSPHYLSHPSPLEARRIYVDGVPTDFHVVLKRKPAIGWTVIDGHGESITVQHIGITPGDLARLPSIARQVLTSTP